MRQGMFVIVLLMGALLVFLVPRSAPFALAAGFGDALTGGMKAAEGMKHVAESLDHARQAADHGAQGHVTEIAVHASEAKKHAEAARDSGVKSSHLDEGITALDKAEKNSKQGNLAVAALAAKDAVTHLAQVR